QKRPTRHRGRSARCPEGVVHGHPGRHPLQPGHQNILSTLVESGQEDKGRARRLYAQIVDHFECHPPRPETLEPNAGLTSGSLTSTSHAFAFLFQRTVLLLTFDTVALRLKNF